MRMMSKYTICPMSTIQYACVIIMHSNGDRRRNWPSTLFSIVRILIKSAIWRIGFEPRMSGKAIHLLLIASTGISQLILIHVKFPSVINTYSNLPYFRPLNRGLSWMLPNQETKEHFRNVSSIPENYPNGIIFRVARSYLTDVQIHSWLAEKCRVKPCSRKTKTLWTAAVIKACSA